MKRAHRGTLGMLQRGMSEHRRRQRFVGGVVAALLAGLGLVGARDAMAHQDPSGCSQSGPAIVVGVFRAQDLKCLGGANVGKQCASNADCPSSACGITASGKYGPGILHDNAIDTTQPPVTAATPKGTGVTPCPASTECITSVCNATK